MSRSGYESSQDIPGEGVAVHMTMACFYTVEEGESEQAASDRFDAVMELLGFVWEPKP